jgi:hypothetical protein
MNDNTRERPKISGTKIAAAASCRSCGCDPIAMFVRRHGIVGSAIPIDVMVEEAEGGGEL